MSEMLKVENIRCGYFHREIVHNASFSVAEGEFCALLGLNGCGKTTLMKAVCGLLPVHDGIVAVDGENCTDFNERQRALRMAYIPQRGSLISGKTVLEVVLMGFNARLHLLDSPGKAHRRKAMEALERLGMGELAQRDYAQLSEGQKQMVILARTIVQDTPVMLMDEPDSALDFVNRNLVLGKIREILHSQNRAGLITLHDPNFALAYCDSLILMQEGKILQRLSLKDAIREEVEQALSRIYGNIRILQYEGGFVMVRGG
ncbi:MAG: ABC transporter ATP-binding protein [Oscillospiraceae bacterium]|nr:ABC transporter ATP-binding protein [Oscillospiraceae bacterium]